MRLCATGALLAVLLNVPASARDISEVRVQFEPGKTGEVIRGQIKGYAIVDYLVSARAGQRISIVYSPSNRSSYFNLLPPDSQTGIHTGSIAGNRYVGTLPKDGNYRIRVYLMRNAARRNETAKYSLAVHISGPPTAIARNPDFADGLSGGPDYWDVANVPPRDILNVHSEPGASKTIIARLANGDTVRNFGCRMVGKAKWCRIEAGTDKKYVGWVNGRYLVESINPPSSTAINSRATGEVPCALALGQPTGRCAFRVSRGGSGNASVWIKLPSGRERYIQFKDGKPVNTDPGLTIWSERNGDLSLIRIGDVERYEIPDAVVFGG